MFWIVLDGNVKISSYLNEQKISLKNYFKVISGSQAWQLTYQLT